MNLQVEVAGIFFCKVIEVGINDGFFNGKQIVNCEWMKRSTKKIKNTPNGIAGSSGYGLSWWMNSREGFSARGYGGQYILCYPERDLVIITTGGLFSNDFFNPDRILGNGILDALDDPVEDADAMKDCIALFTKKNKKNFITDTSNMIFFEKIYKFEDDSLFKLSE